MNRACRNVLLGRLNSLSDKLTSCNRLPPFSVNWIQTDTQLKSSKTGLSKVRQKGNRRVLPTRVCTVRRVTVRRVTVRRVTVRRVTVRRVTVRRVFEASRQLDTGVLLTPELYGGSPSKHFRVENPHEDAKNCLKQVPKSG